MDRAQKVSAIVDNINKQLDIPVLGEETERKAIAWAVNRVESYLPEQALDCMLSASDGISDDEIATMKAHAVEAAAQASPLNDTVDRLLFAPVVDYLFDMARKGVSVVQN